MIGGNEGLVERASHRERAVPSSAEAPRSAENWQELAPWRETAIFHCTAPHLHRLLLHMGKSLAETAAESFSADDLPESCLRAELRAAARDLHYLEGFFTQVGQSAKASDLNREDRQLAAAARQFAQQVARISARIEKRIGPEPTSE